MSRQDSLGFFWQDIAIVREKKEAPPKRVPPKPIWLDPNWLPNYAVAAAFRPNLLTREQFLQLPPGTELLYDVECYPNFFCVTFEVFNGPMAGRHIYFEKSDWCDFDTDYLRLVWSIHTHTGFNNINYDATMVELALAGLDNHRLKAASDMLIVKDDETKQSMRPWEVFKYFKIRRSSIRSDQIDLMNVAPLRAKLKIYGGRLHSPYMQDLPFDPATYLTAKQAVIIRYYNFKDIIHTRYLRYGLAPQLELRYFMSNEYKEDLRSKSDAQMAEAIMRKELSRILNTKVGPPDFKKKTGTQFHYKDPGFLRFQTKLMQDVFNEVLSTEFQVAPSGKVNMPKNLKEMKVPIGSGVYRMGIGGLHSSEKRRSHVCGGGYRILDRDVTSYYPYLIINQELFPSHLGFQFLVIFRGIVMQRVAAKEKAKACAKAGDEAGEAHWNGIAQSLKIVVNGTYGKLGSKWSCLYSPESMIQTTLTGQLSILMLIEAMECVGIKVISANTDGITMMVHDTQHELYLQVLDWWEKICKFETEETEYLGLFSRDVNNYIAVKKPKAGQTPTIKAKGAYANPWNNTKEIEPWMHINPTSQICVQAVEKLLTTGKAIEQTIRECADISQFINVRTVSGGCAVVTRGDYKNRTPSEQVALIEANGGIPRGPGLWTFPDDEKVSDGFVDDDGNLEDGDTPTYTTLSAYKYCIEPTTVDYIGGAIRWYYAKGREEFELVNAKNGNRVGKTTGAMPCLDLPNGIPADLDYEWYIRETERILKDIAYA